MVRCLQLREEVVCLAARCLCTQAPLTTRRRILWLSFSSMRLHCTSKLWLTLLCSLSSQELPWSLLSAEVPNRKKDISLWSITWNRKIMLRSQMRQKRRPARFVLLIWTVKECWRCHVSITFIRSVWWIGWNEAAFAHCAEQTLSSHWHQTAHNASQHPTFPVHIHLHRTIKFQHSLSQSALLKFLTFR